MTEKERLGQSIQGLSCAIELLDEVQKALEPVGDAAIYREIEQAQAHLRTALLKTKKQWNIFRQTGTISASSRFEWLQELPL